MDDFKGLCGFFKSKVSNDVIHICDSLADFLSGTKIMLYFCCYQLFLGSLQPQLRTHHSLLSVVSFLSSAHVHGTFAYRCIHSLSVFSLHTHPLVLLISLLLPCSIHYTIVCVSIQHIRTGNDRKLTYVKLA